MRGTTTITYSNSTARILCINKAGGVDLLSEFYDDELIVFDGAVSRPGRGPEPGPRVWKFDGNSLLTWPIFARDRMAHGREGILRLTMRFLFSAQPDPSIGLELFKFDKRDAR